MTLTVTALHRPLLRLREMLPGTDTNTLACGMCFPYCCDCECPLNQKEKHTTGADQTTSPQPAVLKLHLARSGRTGAPSGVASGRRQTNIELEKEKHRLALTTATVNTKIHAHQPHISQGLPCVRCRAPMPSARHTTRTSNALNACRSCHVFTSAELATHTTRDNLWMALNGGAYDVTAFAPNHPGGLLPLLDVAGCDASDVFRVFHTAEIQARLPAYQVGIMGEFDTAGRLIEGSWTDSPMQKDFHEMVRQLEKDGKFITNFGWYWMKAGVVASILALAVGLLVFGNGHWTTLACSALALGMFWQQLAFLGHDLGHNSVRGSGVKDWFAGLMVTAFFGVSVQWWKRNHNVHHVVTNSLEHDPDIQHLPVLAISEKAFKGFYSSYFETSFSFDWASRLLVAHQHHLYYPVMCVARVNLYAQSILLMCDVTKAVRHRALECLALAFFYVWVGTVFSFLPDRTTMLWYFLISHAMAGLTHVQITLSHFSMPVYEGRGYSADSSHLSREHFLRTQFATSMDVDCPEWIDWLHGGLQFQVAHHLLPRVPRHHLRQVREEYVKPFALRHGLHYHEETFPESQRTVYATLRRAAYASRLLPSPFKQSYLWQLMQADG